MAKVAIVGCGAMGSVYAALMADAGHEVHVVTLHMFTKPTGIFINPATCASTIAGTSRGRRQAPPHGAGPAVGV